MTHHFIDLDYAGMYLIVTDDHEYGLPGEYPVILKTFAATGGESSVPLDRHQVKELIKVLKGMIK